MPQDETDSSVAKSLSSITSIYDRAKLGDHDAVTALWQVYSKRLLGLARSVLLKRGIAPVEATEDSVANAAFANFCAAMSRGKYQEVKDRHELWCLLAVITRNNALNRVKRIRNRIDRHRDTDLQMLGKASNDPTPEEVAALTETISVLEEKIWSEAKTDEQAERVIRVMQMTLSGFTRREIAKSIGRTEATVRRNINMVRGLLNGSYKNDEQ